MGRRQASRSFTRAPVRNTAPSYSRAPMGTRAIVEPISSTSASAICGPVAAPSAIRTGIASAEVAGPGFINLRLAADAQGGILADVLAGGASYGHGDEYAGRNVNLEFVSANPTGPVHLGHSRWAALGDSLHRLLEAAGADVVAEHYINDFGSQVDIPLPADDQVTDLTALANGTGG